MFVSPAFAQAAAAPSAAGSLIGSLLPIIAIVLIMYLLVFRPQRRAMKEREALLAGVKRGDTVVTGGGLVGKVVHVDDAAGELEVDLGGGTKVRAVRAMLADVRAGGRTAAKADDDKPADAEGDVGSTQKVKSRTRR